MSYTEALQEVHDRMALAAEDEHWSLFFELKDELHALATLESQGLAEK